MTDHTKETGKEGSKASASYQPTFDGEDRDPGRKQYPSDVCDDEWAFLAPYLTLMREDAPQREHNLRDLFDGVRWIVKTGSPWRYLPGDFPPWEAAPSNVRRGSRRGDGS